MERSFSRDNFKKNTTQLIKNQPHDNTKNCCEPMCTANIEWEYAYECSCGCHSFQEYTEPGGWLRNRHICLQCGKVSKIDKDKI